MRKILALYLSIGSGHQAAAKAIAQAVRDLAPDVQAETLDPLAKVWEGFPSLMSTLSAVPLLMTRRLYSRLWHDGGDFDLMDRLLDVDVLQAAVGSAIDEFQPDVVVGTHSFPVALCTAMSRTAARPAPPICAVPTDFGLHAFWPIESVERYFVAHPAQRAELMRRGVASERIEVTGIPISPRFAQSPNPRGLRARFRLHSSLPVVVVIAGALRAGPYAAAQLQMIGMLEELNRLHLPAQLVVVCGRNPILRRFLRRRASRYEMPVRVLGYIEAMPELMALASLLVTKPGGLTVSESLARGLPMVLLRPGPGQEEANVRFLIEAGAGWPAYSAEAVAAAVAGLLEDPVRLQAMRERARELGRPNSAYAVAERLLAGRPEASAKAERAQP